MKTARIERGLTLFDVAGVARLWSPGPPESSGHLPP
jgi:hypothetical protein